MRPRVAGSAVELSALLYGKGHVMDVAFHARRGLQRHGHRANGPGCPTAHDDTLGRDCAYHPSLLTDDDLRADHVAFEIAVDLQDASADNLEALAGDPKVIADDRFSRLDGPRTAELRWSNGIGVKRPERYGRSCRGTRHDVFPPAKVDQRQ
jgi:hypothetical protein